MTVHGVETPDEAIRRIRKKFHADLVGTEGEARLRVLRKALNDIHYEHGCQVGFMLLAEREAPGTPLDAALLERLMGDREVKVTEPFAVTIRVSHGWRTDRDPQTKVYVNPPKGSQE